MNMLEQNVAYINAWLDGAESQMDDMENQGLLNHVIKVCVFEYTCKGK